jgi:predicted transcriptional regulator
MDTLMCLRVFGPVTIDDVIARLGGSTYGVTMKLGALVDQGLAVQSGRYFDVSEGGRRHIEQRSRARRREALRPRWGWDDRRR